MKRIFIGGLGRSGTTVALNALYRHPMVYAVPVETKFLVEEDGFADLIAALTDRFSIAGASMAVKRFEHLMRMQVTGLEDSKFTLQHAFSNTIFEQYDTAVDDVISVIHRRRYFPRREALLATTRRFAQATFDAETLKSDKIAWTEKTPSNIWRIGFLRELWPDCYFVHAIRDPRAVLLSFIKRGWFPADMVQALTLFEGYVTALLQVRTEHASDARFYEIRLEDLVTDTPRALADLATALGLDPFDDTAKDALEATLTAYYASQEASEFHLTDRDRDLMNEVLLPAATELGYPSFWDRPG